MLYRSLAGITWLILLLSGPLTALSAQEDAPQQDADSELAEDATEPDVGALDQGPINVDSEQGAAAADGRQRSLERFIPSEQISQDLGVSFPVDI